MGSQRRARPRSAPGVSVGMELRAAAPLAVSCGRVAERELFGDGAFCHRSASSACRARSGALGERGGNGALPAARDLQPFPLGREDAHPEGEHRWDFAHSAVVFGEVSLFLAENKGILPPGGFAPVWAQCSVAAVRGQGDEVLSAGCLGNRAGFVLDFSAAGPGKVPVLLGCWQLQRFKGTSELQ